jgi:hypothetical protein
VTNTRSDAASGIALPTRARPSFAPFARAAADTALSVYVSGIALGVAAHLPFAG